MKGQTRSLLNIYTLSIAFLSQATSHSLDLLMPGAKPAYSDSYLCSSFDVTDLAKITEKPIHVTGFMPRADALNAHHMLLFTCSTPKELPGNAYDCRHHAMCSGPQSILYAWGNNALSTTLPSQVSFTINPTERRYLVLQIHYAHALETEDYSGFSLDYQLEPTKYSAGIFILLRSDLHIPSDTAVVHGDVNCKLPSTAPLNMFSYRVHAHSLSTVITGYVYNTSTSTYREIARAIPHWPQTFYPTAQVRQV